MTWRRRKIGRQSERNSIHQEKAEEKRKFWLKKKMEKLKGENKEEGGTRKGIGGNDKGREEVKEERKKKRIPFSP